MTSTTSSNPWMAGQRSRFLCAPRRRAVAASLRSRQQNSQQSARRARTRPLADMSSPPRPGSTQRLVAIKQLLSPGAPGRRSPGSAAGSGSRLQIVDIPRALPSKEKRRTLRHRCGCLWAGYGPRTTLSSHRILRDIWEIPSVPLHLIDPVLPSRYLLRSPPRAGYVMYFPEAFRSRVASQNRGFLPPEKRIIIREADAGLLCLQRHQRRPQPHPQQGSATG